MIDKKESIEKSRWLLIDTNDKGKDDLLRLAQRIDGYEVRTISKKTYIRFAQGKPKKELSGWNTLRVLSAIRNKAQESDSNPDNNARQYCAVVLK